MVRKFKAPGGLLRSMDGAADARATGNRTFASITHSVSAKNIARIHSAGGMQVHITALDRFTGGLEGPTVWFRAAD